MKTVNEIKVEIKFDKTEEEIRTELLELFKKTIKGKKKNNRKIRKELKMVARKYIREMIGVEYVRN